MTKELRAREALVLKIKKLRDDLEVERRRLVEEHMDTFHSDESDFFQHNIRCNIEMGTWPAWKGGL